MVSESGLPALPPGDSARVQFQYAPADATATPVVAVITPFFNTGVIFEQTHASLLGQSFQQWEWFIVNDASCDPISLAVLDAVRDVDPRIKVIDQPERSGPSAARNLAARSTPAPYLLFLDSDDLLEPTALEKLVWCLESHPEWAVCKGYTVAFGEQFYLSTVGFEHAWLFLDRNPITITAMVRREVFESVGGFDETMRAGLEDWDLWLRFAARGYWGHTLPEPLDWYRRRRIHSDRWHLWAAKGIRQIRRRMRVAYPTLYRQGISYIPERPHVTFQPVGKDLPFLNRLKLEKRLLLITSYSALRAQDEIIRSWLLPRLQCEGYVMSVAITDAKGSPNRSEMSHLTHEVFYLPDFLHPTDYPRFLVYLIKSRQLDTVLILEDPLCYGFLPFLRTHCPDVSYVCVGREIASEIHTFCTTMVNNWADLLTQLTVTREDGVPFPIGRGEKPQEKLAESAAQVSLCAPLARMHLVTLYTLECYRLQSLLSHSKNAIRFKRESQLLLHRLGRWGVTIFLMKERLLTIGRMFKEFFVALIFTKVGFGSTRGDSDAPLSR